MTEAITITVNGEVVAKGRPRMTRRGFIYTPAATRKYEAHAPGLVPNRQPCGP